MHGDKALHERSGPGPSVAIATITGAAGSHLYLVLWLPQWTSEMGDTLALGDEIGDADTRDNTWTAAE